MEGSGRHDSPGACDPGPGLRELSAPMADMQLKTVTRTQGNNRALKDGTVTPQTFAFDFEEVPVLVHAFRRMVRGLEFDICEMALTTYLCAKAHGKRFTALPVFLVRDFHPVSYTHLRAHETDSYL